MRASWCLIYIDIGTTDGVGACIEWVHGVVGMDNGLSQHMVCEHEIQG